MGTPIKRTFSQARIDRKLAKLRSVQRYWSRKARERGVLTEQDLERYLRG